MEKDDVAARLVTANFVPEAVILADGDYPSHPVACAVLERASYVACCDGAADEFVARGGIPGVIVGDGDSLSVENRERFASIIIRYSEQEHNDLTKTVRYLKTQGIKSVAIVGATGKREDHTLGNISLLLDYMRLGIEARIITDYGTFVPASGDCEFESFPRQQVSIFNLGASGLRSEGLQYPLSDFTSWWQGTLNQCDSTRFTIRATGDYLVFLTHNPK